MNLLELHIIQSFPVTCLNRDDDGSPKTAFFGGTQRARVSSQCWKRAIREMAKEEQPEMFNGERTRYIIKDLTNQIIDKISEVSGQSFELNSFQSNDEQKTYIEKYQKLIEKVYAEKERASQNIAFTIGKILGDLDGNGIKEKRTKTLIFLSPLEKENIINSLFDIKQVSSFIMQENKKEKEIKKFNSFLKFLEFAISLKETADLTVDIKKAKKEAKGLLTYVKKSIKPVSINVKDIADIALFGRFVASDSSFSIDSVSYFSHALSTHKINNDIDFFSAVDENVPLDTGGAGHIGDIEFNSACYYRYIGIDLDSLKDEKHLKHFSEDELKTVITTFIEAIIMAVPNARKNSMFGHNPPEYVLGLRRTGHGITLANAFEKAIVSKNGYIQESISAMVEKLSSLKKTYKMKITKEVIIPDISITTFINDLTKEI